MKHNPKGPDGYGPVFRRMGEEWMSRESVHQAEIEGFKIRLIISPSGRDWKLLLDPPKHFRHPGLKVEDKVSLVNL